MQSSLFTPVAPTIHLANWGQVRNIPTENVFSIMVWTPKWASQQKVPALVPATEDLHAYQNGIYTIQQYKDAYINKIDPNQLTPFTLHDSFGLLLPNDVYLCCTCSKTKAQLGHCHRTWAASLLKEAGWSVTLDGKPI